MSKINEFKNFRVFACRYFEGDYMTPARELLRTHKPPLEIGLLNRVGLQFWRFDEEISDGRLERFRPRFRLLRKSELLRKFNHHPLTSQEFVKAKSYIQANPEHHVAVAALQSCVRAYLRDFYKDFSRHYNDRVGSPVAMSDSSTFLQTLSPVLAYILSENAARVNGDLWQDALHVILRKSSFQSVFPESPNQKQLCPFSGPFPYIMSTKLSHCEDGTLTATQGDFGDILKFLCADVRIKLTRDDLDRVASSYEF